MSRARYRLHTRIEGGDLAELFRATRDDGSAVVVKLFHAHTSDARYAQELAETVRALTPLELGGILDVTDLGFVRGRLAVVRDDVLGLTLGQVLQRLTTRDVVLSAPLAMLLGIELLETVQRAHEAGAVHGSITPGNVLLTATGQPTLFDFGALQALLAVPPLRRSFAPRGRTAYRAPETAGGERPTLQADLYSLGAILYELLTLKEAFTGKDGVSTRRENVTPPSRVDRRLNARLDPIVMRALEVTPQRRYRGCGELALALRNFLAASGGMPQRADLRRFVAELLPREAPAKTAVPFGEAFELTPVHGVSLPHVEASLMVDARPSYTAKDEAEAARGFPDVPAPTEKEPSLSLESVGGEGDGEESRSGSASGSSSGELSAEDEPSWIAPPGRATRREKGGTRARVKLVEDFSVSAPPSGAPRRSRRKKVVEKPVEAAPETAENPLAFDSPPNTQTRYPRVRSNPGVKPRRMITEERTLWKASLVRRHRLLLAGALFVAGLLIFGLAIGLKGAGRAPAELLAVTEPELEEERANQGRVIRTERVSSETDPDFIPTRGAGYLSILSSEPAEVFIDGVRLSRRAPLDKYPVKPGVRKIVLESVKRKERREFTLRFEQGQVRTVQENFTHRRPRERR